MSMAMMSFGSNNMSTLEQQNVWPELEGDLLGYDNGFIDPYFQSDELFFSDSYTTLLPYFNSPSDTINLSLSPEKFPIEEFESCHYPKRQKCFGSNCTPTFFDGYVTNYHNPPNPAPEFFPQQIQGTTFDCGNTESCARKENSVSLSAQSIAARERRRRITEKTQELGKLIPGGTKMNTAEMFHAASKYVKFLQAQVALLEVMTSLQEEQEMEPLQSQELQLLLTSPSFQERLYSEEKCLVPHEFVETLVNDQEFQSKLLGLDNIDQLVFLRNNDYLLS